MMASNLSATEPRVVCDYQCHVGEGPVWHPDEQRLYWTDILTGRLFWYEPASGQHAQCYEGRPVGGMTVQADGSMLLFMDRGTVAVWRDGRIEKTIIEEIPEQRDKRFNDVRTDPEGRVFCGILGDSNVQDDVLYLLETDGTYRIALEGIGTSNGMGFSPDGSQFYFTDTTLDVIWGFDYERETGSLTNRRPLIDVSAEQLKPDGMTVDAEGNIWSAMALGGCVICYSPQGRELRRVRFSAKLTTSVIFGGQNFDRLYITSGFGQRKGAEWGEAAGALFEFDPGVKGIPEFRSLIQL